jgi:hypothetical protein
MPLIFHVKMRTVVARITHISDARPAASHHWVRQRTDRWG